MECDANRARSGKRYVQHEHRSHRELRRRGMYAIDLLDQERAVRVMIRADRVVLVGLVGRRFVMVRRQTRCERTEQHDQQ